MSKMLIPACYPGSATRNLRAKSPYEADFPSQTFHSIISAQPERAEVRKLLLQIVCCLASTLTPLLHVSSWSHPIKPFFPFTTTSLQRYLFPVSSSPQTSIYHLLICSSVWTGLMMDILALFSILKADLDTIFSHKEA